MIKGISFFLISLLLIFNSTCKAEDKNVVEVKKDDPDDKFIEDFLADPKNPFASLIPVEKVVPKKEIVEHKKQEEKKKEDQNKIPDDVLGLPAKLIIEGIIWGGDMPQAIISGNLVGEGDLISDAKVVKISQSGVKIKYKGYSIFLKNKIE